MLGDPNGESILMRALEFVAALWRPWEIFCDAVYIPSCDVCTIGCVTHAARRPPCSGTSLDSRQWISNGLLLGHHAGVEQMQDNAYELKGGLERWTSRCPTFCLLHAKPLAHFPEVKTDPHVLLVLDLKTTGMAVSRWRRP